MAKENVVILNGTLEAYPKAKVKDGRLFSGSLIVRVADRITLTNESKELNFADIMVYSRDEALIRSMTQAEKGDLCEVYGTLTTANAPVRYVCPHCGNEMLEVSSVQYVTPLFFAIREKNIPESQMRKRFEELIEFSNRITIMGEICNDPVFIEEPSPHLVYVMNVDRTVRVHDDTSGEAADHPVVRINGERARQEKNVLENGSVVYIRGHLRTSNTEKSLRCDRCDTVFTKKGVPETTITPHFTEYLKNCKLEKSDKNKKETKNGQEV